MRVLFDMEQNYTKTGNPSILVFLRAIFNVPVFLFIALLIISFFSAAIPILGPKEEHQETPTKIIQQGVTKIKRDEFGPTTKANTLWGVAKRITPAGISIYKSMGAIYRLNPQAFEKGNIHLLIPGSVLVMPTRKEMQREKITEVSRRLSQDEKLILKNAFSVEKMPSKTAEKIKMNKVDEKTQNLTTQIKEIENTKNQTQESEFGQHTSNVETNKKPSKQNEHSYNVFDAQKIAQLIREQMNDTNQNITKLLENNHALKLRIFDIQNELSAVKDQLKDGESLNKEIQKFLEIERSRAENKKESTFFEKLRENFLLLTSLAVLPALLLISGIFLLLRRKNASQVSNSGENVAQKIDKTNSNNNEQAEKDNLDLSAAFDDDEELDFSSDINADELFNQHPVLKEEKIPQKKPLVETAAIEKETKQIEPKIETMAKTKEANKQNSKYDELNELARQAEEYADSIETNRTTNIANEEEIEVTPRKVASNETTLTKLDDKLTSNEELTDGWETPSLEKNSVKQSYELKLNSNDGQDAENNSSDKSSNGQFIPSILDEAPSQAEPASAFEAAADMDSLSFPTVDEINLDDLGEFEEDDAFNAALVEQRELEEFINEKYNNDKLLLSDDEAQLMAGLDMNALLSASSNDDDDTQALNSELTDDEDWSTQPNILEDEFKRIFEETDQLMQNSGEEKVSFNIDELSDVTENIDVTLDQISLAKAYIEMNDTEAALPILNDLLESHDADIRKEAKSLLEKLEKTL